MLTTLLLVGLGAILIASVLILPSIVRIAPTEVGLVTKRFSGRKLSEDNPIALEGEAGYQADLLMPGLRFKLMLSAYLLWRLLIDGLKPLPYAWPFGLSGIQWVCTLALSIYLPLTIRQWRQRHFA